MTALVVGYAVLVFSIPDFHVKRDDASCVVEPSPIALRLKRGGRVERTITVRNRTQNAVRFTRYESSCDCLTAVMPIHGLSIAPEGNGQFLLVLDMAHDPKYVGGFAPQVTLMQAGTHHGVTAVVDAEVTE